MDEIQPRQVEAGALKRWHREALELSSRRVGLWLIFSVFFIILCAVASIGQLVLLGMVSLIAAALIGMSYGVLIAAYIDRHLSGPNLRRILRRPRLAWYLGSMLLGVVRHNLLAILFGTLCSAVPNFFLSSGNLSESFNPVVFVVVVSLLSLFAYVLLSTNSYKTHLHRFLSVVLLGVPWDGSLTLIHQGFLLNQHVMATLNLRRLPWFALFLIPFIPLLLAALITVPFGEVVLIPLGLMLFPYASSLFYVSFRDIYLGVAENSPAKAERRQRAPIST